MAFFDELGKKITSAGEGAVNKGKAFADVTRLNSAVSDEEKKIDSLYFQIGRLYTSLHPQDCDEELVSYVNAVLASQQKINELKQQIQDIKGIVKCEKCGASVPNNTAFCSSCGSPMPRKEGPVLDVNHMLCDNCGAVIEKNTRFCTSCGKVQYSSMPAAPAGFAPAAPYPYGTGMPVDQGYPINPGYPDGNYAFQDAPQGFEPVQGYDENDVICPSCGAAIQDGLQFCTICGYSLNAQPEYNAADDNNASTSDSDVSDTTDAEIQKCPSCGAAIRDNLKFCTACGYSLDAPSTDDSPVDIYSSSKDIDESDEEDKKCPSCGATVNDGFAFCVECGKAIN